MKGIIYEIKCNITNEIYIGSTVKSLKDRMRIHLGNKNCSSIQILNRNNYGVNIIETIECESIKELRIKEREYYDKIDCINKHRPYRTEDEKIEDCKLTYKKYNENNKDKVKEYNKAYREANKEKLQLYEKSRAEAKKEYNKKYYYERKNKNV